MESNFSFKTTRIMENRSIYWHICTHWLWKVKREILNGVWISNFSDSSDSSSSSSSDDSSSSDSSDEDENESSDVKRVEEQKRRVGGMGASDRPPRSADHPDSKGVRANRRNWIYLNRAGPALLSQEIIRSLFDVLFKKCCLQQWIIGDLFRNEI